MAMTCRTAVLAAAVLALAGCYTYQPLAQPRTGVEVRVDVPVTSSVGSTARDPQMMSFEGLLVGMGDTLLLQTRSRQPMGTHGEFSVVDTIRVQSSAYANLEERVLSTPRTIAFTAAVVGAGALLVAAIDGWAGSEENGKGDGGNPNASVVSPRRGGWKLFDIRIPFGFPSG